MKKIILVIILLPCVAFAELTDRDLRKMDELIEKQLIASEKRMREYIDLRFKVVDERFKSVDQRFDLLEKSIDQRFDAVDQRFESVHRELKTIFTFTMSLIAFIILAIGVPQTIMMWRDRTLKAEIAELRRERFTQ